MRPSILLLHVLIAPLAFGQQLWERLNDTRSTVVACLTLDSTRVGAVDTGVFQVAYRRAHGPEHVHYHFSIDGNGSVDSALARDWPEWLLCDSIVAGYEVPAELDRDAGCVEATCDPLVVNVRPGTWLVLHRRWSSRSNWSTPTEQWRGRSVLTIIVQRDADGRGRLIYHYTPVERSEWKRLRKGARKRRTG